MNNSNYSHLIMTLAMLAIFTVMVGIASTYPPGARFMVFVVGFPAIALCLLQLVLDLRARRNAGLEAGLPQPGQPAALADMPTFDDPNRIDHSPETARKEVILWVYFLALIGGILLFGFYISVPIFLFTFLYLFAQANLRSAALLAGVGWLIMYVVFTYVFRMPLHIGFITEYLMDRISG